MILPSTQWLYILLYAHSLSIHYQPKFIHN